MSWATFSNASTANKPPALLLHSPMVGTLYGWTGGHLLGRKHLERIRRGEEPVRTLSEIECEIECELGVDRLVHPRNIKRLDKLDWPITRRILNYLRRRDQWSWPTTLCRVIESQCLIIIEFSAGENRLICELDKELTTILVLCVAHRKSANRKQ